jgi:hypothetical protein
MCSDKPAHAQFARSVSYEPGGASDSLTKLVNGKFSFATSAVIIPSSVHVSLRLAMLLHHPHHKDGSNTCTSFAVSPNSPSCDSLEARTCMRV